MKFYAITFTNSRGIKRITWRGTASGAVTTHKHLHSAHKDVSTVEIDVPTDRPALLEFLNQYATGDLS